MKARKIDAARLACLAIAAIVVAGLAFFASRSLASAQPQGAPAAQAAPAGQSGAPPAARGGGGFRHPDAIDFDDHDGFVSLFDGATLGGWIGDTDYWSVKDGAIYANSTCERPTGTIYIYWTGGVAGDFQLKMQMKGTGNVNSGIQYRSWLAIDPNSPKPPARGRGPAGPGAPGRAGAVGAPGGAPGGAAAAAARGGAGRGPQCANPGTPPGRDPNKAEAEDKFNMGGPQYDFDNTDMYPGQFYEQSTGRGIIAWPGEVVEADPGKPPRLLATLADDATLHTWFHKNDWNQEVVVASGHTYTHILNGHVVSILIDYNPMWFQSSGHIGVEIESTGEVFFKDVWLKKFN